MSKQEQKQFAINCLVPCHADDVGGLLCHAMTWYISSNVTSRGLASPLDNTSPLYPVAPREPLIPPGWEQLQFAVPENVLVCALLNAMNYTLGHMGGKHVTSKHGSDKS